MDLNPTFRILKRNPYFHHTNTDLMILENINIAYIHKEQVKTVQIAPTPFYQHELFSFLLTKRDNRLRLILTPKEPMVLQNISLHFAKPFLPEEKIFSNGYQTWTESMEFGVDDKMLGLRTSTFAINKKFKLPYYGDYFFKNYPNKKGRLHSYTYAYFKQDDQMELWGSLAEKSGFTIFDIDTPNQTVTISKDCKNLLLENEFIAFDLFNQKRESETVWENYFAASGINAPTAKPMSGWTSWYHYYTKIDEKIILQNLAAFQENKTPIDIFQIDDGYQMAVGDWNPNKKSEGKMQGITTSIHDAGYKAGLWYAPFVCEENSTINQEHPDWILRYEDGSKVIAGYSLDWSGNFYVLDFENFKVKNHIRKAIRQILSKWNFDMIKMDFLYAIAIHPPKNKTKGQMMWEGMQFLKAEMGDKLLLACGVPLGAAFGQTDFCRIGSDVALKWEDKILKNVVRYRERVSTINALRSAIGRQHLDNRFFLNDPDVFILRDEKNSLTPVQKHTLFVLNQIFGSLLFTSDFIGTYDDETMALYNSQFPLCSKKILPTKNENDVYSIQLKIGDNNYFVGSNLNSKATEIKLDNGLYFEDNQFVKQTLELAPFQTKIIKKYVKQDCEILSSTGHLFPGAEIESYKAIENFIEIQKKPQSQAVSNLIIAVPNKYNHYFVNDEEEWYLVEKIQNKTVIKISL